VITPEVLDNFELALRDIYHGRTSHTDIDVVNVAAEKPFTHRESNPPLDLISVAVALRIGLISLTN